MATSPVVPIPVTNTADRTRDSLRRRKRKKMQRQSEANDTNQNNQNSFKNDHQITQWKSDVQQRVYSSKLLQALRHVRLRQSSGTGNTPNKARAIRETADRVLAVTAKGRTRWSRAILKNKLRLKFMKTNRKQRGLIATATGNSRLKKPKVHMVKLKRKNLPEVQRKARVLGGLVPGCQKQRLPVVLEEASSYIPALEMQVKAMAALVELLSGGSSSNGDASDLGRVNVTRPPPWL